MINSYIGGRFEVIKKPKYDLLSTDVGTGISVYGISDNYPWMLAEEIRMGPLIVYADFDDRDKVAL